jgi:hypothetical protein
LSGDEKPSGRPVRKRERQGRYADALPLVQKTITSTRANPSIAVPVTQEKGLISARPATMARRRAARFADELTEIFMDMALGNVSHSPLLKRTFAHAAFGQCGKPGRYFLGSSRLSSAIAFHV